ncbi:MAG: L-fucose/L-arabinose isomerase family protein [Candidatus Thorarchaeota archaeon]
MQNPKVGLITLSLARERTDIAKQAHKGLLKELKKQPLEVIPHDELVLTMEDSVRISEDMAHNHIHCIIYNIGSWIYAPMVVSAIQATSLPSIVYGYRSPAAFSLVGAAITHGSLDELNLQHRFVYGKPDSPDVLMAITSYCRAAMAFDNLSRSKAVVIGGKTMGMITSAVDFSQIKDLFGTEIEHVDMLRLYLDAEKVPKRKVKEKMAWAKKTYGSVNVSDEILEKSIRLYFSMKDLMKSEGYTFGGFKCQPEFIDNYVSGCMPISWLINEGIMISCEADMNAAFTMQILHLVSGQPVLFADVNDLDMNTGILRLVNCGTIATDLAVSSKDVDWNPQYEYMGKAGGACPTFSCKEGQVTLARLARVGGEYVMQIASGEAFVQEKETFAEARDRWPHAFITLEGDPDLFIQHLRSNHLHMVYGDVVDELYDLCEILGIEPIYT